jgi:hypothetical protein
MNVKGPSSYDLSRRASISIMKSTRAILSADISVRECNSYDPIGIFRVYNRLVKLQLGAQRL